MPEYRPWPLRTFGVEMEMTHGRAGPDGRTGGTLSERMLRNALSPVVRSLNQREAGYYHSNGETWDVKTDSSCGWEIASPAFNLDERGDNNEVRAACNALTAINPLVDSSCGLHVHADCSDYEWKDLQRLIILWTRYEPFFFELMPRSRRNNLYCAPVYRSVWNERSSLWSYVYTAISSRTERGFRDACRSLDRRLALNFGSWWRNGRIEVRLHSGTVNYAKIKHWTMLVSAVMNRPRLVQMPEIRPMANNDQPGTRLSTEYICKSLGLLPTRFMTEIPQESKDLAVWVHTRRLQFTPEAARPGEVLPTTAPLPPPVHEYRENVSCEANIGHSRGVDDGLWEGRTCPNPRGRSLRCCDEHSEDYHGHVAFRDTTVRVVL